MNINELVETIGQRKTRGTYQNALKNYALELCYNIESHHTTTAEELQHIEKIENLKERALNGATSWEQYSWGGCSLVYDDDIKQMLFCKSWNKRHPNADTVNGYHLLDLQAFALGKAFSIIQRIVANAKQ